MEFDLCPSVTLQTGTYNAVVAPAEVLIAALNTTRELQRFMFLYVCGNYSQILTHVNRTSGNFDVRRGFTAFQLLTILREAYHTVILVEHDPTLYECDEKWMVLAEVVRAFRAAAQEAIVVLYSPSADRIFHTLAKQADRVFYLAPLELVSSGSSSAAARRRQGRGIPGLGRQTTLEAFHGKDNHEQQARGKGSCEAVVPGYPGAQEGGAEVRGGAREDGAAAQQRGVLRIR
jgi:DNA polymerase I